MINPRVLGLLIILSIPVYWGLWKIIFEDWEDFKDCLYFWITPRWLDWLRGELFEDTWANFKLFVFFLLCIVLIALEYSAFSHYLPNLTKSM
ncbi:MAG TPA: hypothetical protein VMB78_08635 [Dissulfurispiraceae bacterium]|nr:hypothetical protein [Dissulfurispiraceae bacterium]